MERKRKVKIIIMIALMVTITGMSLGFAAFSASLNISSSATVNPNSSDFNIKVYGIDSKDKVDSFRTYVELNGGINESLLSTTASAPYFLEEDADVISGTMALIDNSSMSVSNMNVTFTKPVYNSAIYYTYVLKNEGQYTAYLDFKKLAQMLDANISCVGLEGTTPALAEAACEDLKYEVFFSDSKGSSLGLNEVVVDPESSIIIIFLWQYGMENENAVLPDGPIKYSFENVKLPFTTVPAAE